MSASAKQSVVSANLPSISAQRKRKASPSRQRDTRGDRYSLTNAYQPGAGLARGPQSFGMGSPVGQPKSQVVVVRNDKATVAVADPYEPGKRIQATVNRRVDLLEYERSHGNITVSQYEVGRQVQATFERAAGARNTRDRAAIDETIVDRSKRTELKDLAAVRAIDSAREVQELMVKIERAIGGVPAHFLRELLTRGGTIKDYVRSKDMLASDRKVTETAIRFRYLLEALDDTFAATGAVVRDQEGNTLIRTELGEATGEETDEKGRLVPAGKGHRWGRVQGEEV